MGGGHVCGILGRCVVGEGTVDADEIHRSLASISHRGPDGTGVWTGPGIGLGHVRLSILDLSELAAQPMVSSDGRWVIVFNGEIYNFRQLRDDLAAHGVTVTS